MILVISPSKSMDMAPLDAAANATQPAFLAEAAQLVAAARKLSRDELMNFLGVSEKLAKLSHDRFQQWAPPFTRANAKPALFAFTGDVYAGLAPATLPAAAIDHAQHHLRVLSGLYGLLRPLDLIQPYRLEMGRPLATRGAKNLYEFWKRNITTALNNLPGKHLVNLASNEYFNAIDTKALNKSLVSPVFKDEKNGVYKIISFHAKKARGAMARHLLETRTDSPAGLQTFNTGGYAYAPDLSTDQKPVFTRPEAR